MSSWDTVKGRVYKVTTDGFLSNSLYHLLNVHSSLLLLYIQVLMFRSASSIVPFPGPFFSASSPLNNLIHFCKLSLYTYRNLQPRQRIPHLTLIHVQGIIYLFFT